MDNNTMMMNPKLLAIMELLGQSPSDLMSMNMQNGEAVTPDYPMPEMAQLAQSQNAGLGYLDTPQDFGGLESLLAIRQELQNPNANKMQMPKPSLPEIENMSGQGMGNLAPKAYNPSGIRKSIIAQLMQNMGM